MADCPSSAALERLARGALSTDEAAAAEEHVESCARCAEALGRLPYGAELIERIRDLQRSRAQIADGLSTLTDLERRISTTLFGAS